MLRSTRLSLRSIEQSWSEMSASCCWVRVGVSGHTSAIFPHHPGERRGPPLRAARWYTAGVLNAFAGTVSLMPLNYVDGRALREKLAGCYWDTIRLENDMIPSVGDPVVDLRGTSMERSLAKGLWPDWPGWVS